MIFFSGACMPGISPSEYKILVILCFVNSYSVAAVVLILRRYIYHELKLCKMQFSATYSTFFKDSVSVKQSLVFTCLQYKCIERKHYRKGEIAHTSISSFSHSVFYPLGELSAIFIRSKIIVFEVIQFGIV